MSLTKGTLYCTLFRIRFDCVDRAPFAEIKGTDLQETVLNTSFFYATNIKAPELAVKGTP